MGPRSFGRAFAAGRSAFSRICPWTAGSSPSVSALSLITSLLFGLWPAWHTSRADIQLALKSGGHGSSDAPRRAPLARSARDREVALTLVLLSAAGLVLKSFANARDPGLGFDPQLLLSARVDLPEPSYSDAKKVLNFSEALDGEVVRAARRGACRDRLESAAHDGLADVVCAGRHAGTGARQVSFGGNERGDAGLFSDDEDAVAARPRVRGAGHEGRAAGDDRRSAVRRIVISRAGRSRETHPDATGEKGEREDPHHRRRRAAPEGVRLR